MSSKMIFVWAVALGIAIAGGVDSVLTLLFWVAFFWALEKVYDVAAAFCRGFRSSYLERKAAERNKRPELRVIQGGK